MPDEDPQKFIAKMGAEAVHDLLERLDLDDAIGFYKNIGNAFKSNWKGWNTWVFSGHLEAMKRVGLKPSKKSKWINAKIECVWYRYQIFEGSLKEFKTGLSEGDLE